MTGTNFIEFFGPPGSGKTTIFKKIIADKRFYGGYYEDGITRALESRDDFKYQLLLKAGKLFLRTAPSRFHSYFKFPVLNILDYFPLFVVNHPEYLSLLAKVMKSGPYQKETLVKACVHSAARYQLGVSTVKSDEILTIDEGFLQRAHSIILRKGEFQNFFKFKEYFEVIPLPRAAIHVTAPPEVCLSRQRNRGEDSRTFYTNKT